MLWKIHSFDLEKLNIIISFIPDKFLIDAIEENIKATSPMLLKKSIDVLIDNNIMSKASLVMNLSNWGLHLNQDEVEVLLGFKEGKLTWFYRKLNHLQLMIRL